MLACGTGIPESQCCTHFFLPLLCCFTPYWTAVKCNRCKDLLILSSTLSFTIHGYSVPPYVAQVANVSTKDINEGGIRDSSLPTLCSLFSLLFLTACIHVL